MNVPLKGTDCLHKSFDDIFLLPPYKVVFRRTVPLFHERQLLCIQSLCCFSFVQVPYVA